MILHIVNSDFFCLTDDLSYKKVRHAADQLLAGLKPETDELTLALARYLENSKKKLERHKNKPLRLAIVMNLVHEHNRLRPSSPENPHGENALENKLKQLEWLFAGTAVDYTLIYVSGHCPWGSDAVLDEQIARLGTEKVVHLQMADYEEGKKYTPNCKGGEVIFGMHTAAGNPGYPDLGLFDCFLMTDADMTFDMGQAGFLLDLYHRGEHVITGNRTHPDSILIKNPTRAGTGVLMYRHIQRKLAPLFFIDMNLHDTQCPWKFLSREALKAVTPALDCMDWSIDTDILSSAWQQGYGIRIIPVTAVDSEFESHGKALGHYVRNKTIIEGTMRQVMKYNLPSDRDIAALVRQYLKTEADYKALLESGLPESLKHLPNAAWGVAPEITLEIVENWLSAITQGKKTG